MPALLLPRVEDKITVYAKDGLNSDIQTAIMKEVPRAVDQTKELSKNLCGATARDTARNIYNWLMHNVTYVKDGNAVQVVKQPNALVRDGGDCKSYALATIGILKNCGYPAYLRFTSYDPKEKTPTHVYAYTTEKNGTPVIIDAVWGTFDDEKKYQFKKDKRMDVIAMHGVDRSPDAVMGIFAKHKKKHPGLFKKAALSAPRNAFLGLVVENVRGLASHFQEAIQRGKGNDISAAWVKLGGNYSKLQDAINKGAKKKPLFGEKAQSGIGVIAVAAALAAAAPIIAVMIKFFGGNKPKNPDGSTETGDQEIEDLANESGAALIDGSQILAHQDGTPGKHTPGGKMPPHPPKPGGMGGNMPLLLAAGVGLYLLTQKK